MTLLELLEYTYLVGGFTTKSDLARVEADLIAEACDRGCITTKTPRDGYGSVWRLSHWGMGHLNMNEDDDGY